MKCNRCKKANLAKLANSEGDTRYYCKDCLNTWIVLSEANQKKLADEEAARKAKLAKTFAIIKQCPECKPDKFDYAQSFDCLVEPDTSESITVMLVVTDTSNKNILRTND